MTAAAATPMQQASLSPPVDIVALIGGYVKLVRRGRSWAGLCPFHNSRQAAFHVLPEQGEYLCFGCGERGRAEDFARAMGDELPALLHGPAANDL